MGRKIKNTGIIIISTDRGLCGGLNSNLFKIALKQIKKYQTLNIKINVCLVGTKAEYYFKKISNINIISIEKNFKNIKKMPPTTNTSNTITKYFKENKIDNLIIFNNRFINTIKQEPAHKEILPINKSKKISEKSQWDYIYEPNSKIILEYLLDRYIESQIHYSIIENLACEQAARMIAMKNATDNATEIINTLKIQYNKTRQATITQELAELVSGSSTIQ